MAFKAPLMYGQYLLLWFPFHNKALELVYMGSLVEIPSGARLAQSPAVRISFRVPAIDPLYLRSPPEPIRMPSGII